MKAQDILDVQNSWKLAHAYRDKISEIFYGLIVSNSDELKEVYTNNLSNKSLTILEILDVAIPNLHQLDSIKSKMELLGTYYKKNGVVTEFYRQFIECFLASLRYVLPDQFTDNHCKQWSDAIVKILNCMMNMQDEKQIAYV